MWRPTSSWCVCFGRKVRHVFFGGNMLLSPNVEEFGHHFPHLGLNLVPTKMKIALEHSPKVQGYMGKTTIVCWKWGYSISRYFFLIRKWYRQLPALLLPKQLDMKSSFSRRFLVDSAVLPNPIDFDPTLGLQEDLGVIYIYKHIIYIYTLYIYIYIYQGNTIAAKIKHGHNILWPTDPTPCGPRALQSDWSRKVP